MEVWDMKSCSSQCTGAVSDLGIPGSCWKLERSRFLDSEDSITPKHTLTPLSLWYAGETPRLSMCVRVLYPDVL